MPNEVTPGQEPTPTGQEPTEQQPQVQQATTIDDPKVLRTELERARKEAAKYRTQAREAAEEKRKAEEAALAEQGKHKELAEARAKALEEKEKELAELRTFKGEREQRETEERQKREAQVVADFAALPEDVRADVPNDDLRAMEIAVRTYQRAQGTKAPATAPAAPARVAPAGGEKPPKPTAAEQQKYAMTRDPKLKAELGAKIRAFEAWSREHPGES